MLPCRRLAVGKAKECLTVREFLGHRIGGGTCLRAVITRERDEGQRTAIRPPCLSHAPRRERLDAVRFLVKHGADFNAWDKAGWDQNRSEIVGLMLLERDVGLCRNGTISVG